MLRRVNEKKGIQGIVEYTEKMVAALAHEIRNPLNSMKGAAEYINKKYAGTSEIREFLGIILSEIDRVDNYLNEFLNFSRGVKLKMTRVNLKNFVGGIVMTVKHSFPYELDVDIEKADIDIELDAEQVRQVLVNLLTNAKDAVKEAQPKVPRVVVMAYYLKTKAYICVTDNGGGMKASVLKSIFMPFYTTRETGMGIGLSICRAIVQRHNGRIRVETKYGKGSVFSVEMPLKRKKVKNG